MSWFNVLNIVGWLKGGVETPVSQADKLPVDTGLTGLATAAKQLPDNHQVSVSNFPAVQEVVGTVDVANFPSEYPLPSNQVQVDALTDAQLRATPVPVTGTLTVEPAALQQVADDYQTGEILPDQVGAGSVLTFTFSAPVQNIWVYAVDPSDLTASGEVRVDPYGGTPSASLGIPVSFGGGFPISATTSAVKVFAPSGVRVTVYGNRRG